MVDGESFFVWAVFVAQLAEHLLSTTEVHSLNPVIGGFLYRTIIYCQLYLNEKKRKKEAGNRSFKNVCQLK